MFMTVRSCLGNQYNNAWSSLDQAMYKCSTETCSDKEEP